MILRGDCIEIMKAIKPNSVDAIVTDPPYGLEFMGKEWDKLWNKSQSFNVNRPKSGAWYFGNTPSSNNRPQYQAGLQMQLWHTQWLIEAYRVLKPGASMLVMGGTRTFHRLMVAIEDSGFIIKDCLMWIYGSGFPKAQDLGKMIDKRMGKERGIVKRNRVDGKATGKKASGLISSKNVEYMTSEKGITDLAKHWDGFKIGGIKPAYEPIVWAVKPPEGSYIDNVLKWGVGAVNVDECRIGVDDGSRNRPPDKPSRNTYARDAWTMNPENRKAFNSQSKGRFPANIILDEEAGRVMDEQSGNLQSGKLSPDNKVKATTGWSGGSQANRVKNTFEVNSGGASRFFYCAKASRGERNQGLEGMEKHQPRYGKNFSISDKGSISASKNLNQNNHPTVKPIALFEWLIKLVTREGQVVLDPFLGSGTTAIAAHKTGRECVGIEREDDYVKIAKRRIDHWQTQPQQRELLEAGNV